MLLPILEPGINKKYKKIQKNQKILEENIYIYIRDIVIIIHIVRRVQKNGKSIIQCSKNCQKMVEENNIRD